MQKKLILDNSLIAEDFFEDYQLIGVQALVTPTVFCTEMKAKLGFSFKRIPQNDPTITFFVDKKSGLGIPGTLFENIPMEAKVHFGFYRFEIPFSNSDILLYENKKSDYLLIKELPEIDYLFLMSLEHYEYNNQPFIHWLSLLSSVKDCCYLDIDTLGESKTNLLF
ncbi:MAG TPA: hypothetical protein PKX92_00420 [Edaphocola sp.]|nr:hypothetical protein [Edaphocola sp.]